MKLTLSVSVALFAVGAGILLGLDVLLARVLGVRP